MSSITNRGTNICRATITFPVGRQLEILGSGVDRAVLSDN